MAQNPLDVWVPPKTIYYESGEIAKVKIEVPDLIYKRGAPVVAL